MASPCVRTANSAVDLGTVNLLPEGLLCAGRAVTVVDSEGDDAITVTPGPDVIPWARRP